MPQTKHPHPGLFLAIEGVDGAGKSWATEQLRSIALEADGRAPVMVREPGGTPFGEELRRTLSKYRRDLSPEAQALTFNASRRELTDQVIRPALQAGLTVIADRWTPSTRVYQHECNRKVLDQIIAAAAQELADADLTLLFTRDPAEAVDAKLAEYGAENRQREIEYLTALQDLYMREMAQAEPARWIQCPFTSMGQSMARMAAIYQHARAK